VRLRKNRRNEAQQGAQPFGRLAAFVHLAGKRHCPVGQCGANRRKLLRRNPAQGFARRRVA